MREDTEDVQPDDKPAPRASEPKAERVKVPAIGRIVGYVTRAGTVRPAIISMVWDRETVDLTVFNSEGAAPVVRANLDTDGELVRGTWHWPSY